MTQSDTVYGVDVSEFQSVTLPWGKIKEVDQIEFGLIRSSYGTYKDPSYAAHKKAMEAVEILTSCYHFMRPSQDLLKQLKVWTDAAGKIPVGNPPPTIDIEHSRKEGLSPEEGKQWAAFAKEIIQRAEDFFQRRITIYTYFYLWPQLGRDGLDQFFAERALHIASYPAKPRASGIPGAPPPWTRARIWQYGGDANKSVLEACPTFPDGKTPQFIDKNVFLGSREDWENYCKDTLVIKPTPMEHPIMKVGSHGPTVMWWQEWLRSTGEALVSPDGIFGKETSAATIRWQRKTGLTPDGVVGPQSLARARVDGYLH